ncbi:MAG: glycerate kinase [Cyclobacteriaceae bacterium]
MKILICQNAFKGALSAENATEAVDRGLSQSGLNFESIKLPIADGGDGTLRILKDVFNLSIITTQAYDPFRRSIQARYGWAKSSKIGFIELAEASGIKHLKKSELNPWTASTYGSGIILSELIDKGAKEIYLALGGSASVDGGVGILEALGVKFYDSEDNRLRELNPAKMNLITRVDAGFARRKVQDVKIRILCDVENPLLGINGSAVVFAPQKGASAEDVKGLENRLSRFSSVISDQFGVDVSNVKHGGAAGGVAAALKGVLNAQLLDGAHEVLKLVEFEEKMRGSDIVITGEGKIDHQTLSGKGPGLIAYKSNDAGKRTIGFCGVSEDAKLKKNPFSEIIEINQESESLEDSLKNANSNLVAAAKLLGERLKVEYKRSEFL